MKELDLKEMGGVVFNNDRKTEDRHPDLKGQILIRGERLDIALWAMKTGKGYSIRIEPPRESTTPVPKKEEPEDLNGGSSDLPF